MDNSLNKLLFLKMDIMLKFIRLLEFIPNPKMNFSKSYITLH